MAALLAANATVDLADDGARRTPLHGGGIVGHHEVVTALLAPAARPSTRRTNGATPLLRAAEGAHHEVVTALLAANATVDLAMNDGDTPLFSRRRAGTTRS